MKSNSSNILLSLVAVVVTIGFLYLAIQLLRDPNEKKRPLFSNGNWNSDFEYSQSFNSSLSSSQSILPGIQKVAKSSAGKSVGIERGNFLLNKSNSASAIAKLDLNSDQQFFSQYMNVEDGSSQTMQRSNRKRISTVESSSNLALSDFKLKFSDITRKRVERTAGTSVLSHSDILGNSNNDIVKVAPPTEADPGAEVPVGSGVLTFTFLVLLYSALKLRRVYLLNQ